MAVVEELLRVDQDALSFGNYQLTSKTKKDGFEWKGDLYKVKTFHEITKLEKNGLFAYESVPGTAVSQFKEQAEGVTFTVEGPETAQVIVGLEEDCEYDVFLDDVQVDRLKTNVGGKLTINVELGNAPVRVRIVKGF
jgi:hypothetical protein